MALVVFWSNGIKEIREVDDSDVFVGRNRIVPVSVSRFQARAALMDSGLLADAEIAVSSMGPLEQLAWAEATEWRRDSPTIDAMAGLLNLSVSDVDNLFIEASKIVA